MKRPFAGFFDDDADRLEQDAEFKIKVDPFGNPVIEPVREQEVSLSDHGTIKRLKITTDRYHPCGCSAEEPSGGRCGERRCGLTACARCFKRCEACLCPLCIAHQRRTLVEGKVTVLCRRCLAKQMDRRVLRKLACAFVRLDGPKDP